MKQRKQSKRRVVLSVKGKAATIGRDDEAYQRLLDEAAEASAEEGIRQGLEDVKHGRCQPVREFFKEFEAKHGITSSRASRPVPTRK